MFKEVEASARKEGKELDHGHICDLAGGLCESAGKQPDVPKEVIAERVPR